MSAVYIPYDGALDPLGASQIVPYVEGLAATGVTMTLITFEKRERWQRAGRREAMRRRLAQRGVTWRPVAYHKRPRLAVTLWDVLIGSRVGALESRRSTAAVVHSRGDVAMVMARWAIGAPRARLLYDVRLRSVLADPHLGERCRGLAEQRYSVEFGVSAYRDLYAALGA